jgi:protein-S-isoprenylcysteine O-methyltransferase Ste14
MTTMEAPPRYFFPKRYADRVQRLRVASGFLLLFTFAWFSHPTLPSIAAGLFLSLFGLGIRAWAAGHLVKDQQLTTSGPYAYMRNPLYAGTLLAAAGIVVACRSVVLRIIAAAVFLLVYLPVIELEEQHLRDIFPGYAAYASQVNRLLPLRKCNSGYRRFSGAVYRRNQEYKAALGLAVALAWMLLKYWLSKRST